MKVLIATSRFSDYAGSEITALEIAEEFVCRGAATSIYAQEVGQELRATAEKVGASVFDDASKCETSPPWDLIWVIHAVAFYDLFCHGVKGSAVIFHSLSHFEPLEAPPVALRKIDAFLVNSDENRRHFCVNYPKFAQSVDVFPNSVPREYFKFSACSKRNPKRRIAIVSNHAPAELIKIISDAPMGDCEIEHVGVGGRRALIGPELLAHFDAVVSIGKTVPYCLAMGIPVYCYDHFGGPGWITIDNVGRSFLANFSGRSEPIIRSQQELRDALLGSGEPNFREITALKKWAGDHLSLEHNVSRIVDKISVSRSCRKLEPIMPMWRGKQERTTLENILLCTASVIKRYRKLELELRTAFQTCSDQRAADIATLTRRVVDEQANARAQILYRDELVDVLHLKLSSAQSDQEKLIEMHNSLLLQVERLERLVSTLESRNRDIDANASAQIHYRDELVAQLQEKILAIERNSTAQIHYRDELVSELEAIKEKLAKEISELAAALSVAETELFQPSEVLHKIRSSVEQQRSVLGSRRRLLLRAFARKSKWKDFDYD